MVKVHKMEQQKKKVDEDLRKKARMRELLRTGEFMVLDESCEAFDCRVRVMETATGKTISGEEAPLLRHLFKWLQMHPGWEFVLSDGDDSDEDDKNNENPNKDEDREKTAEEKELEAIKKAKVEDDEYKTEEQNYYSIAHDVREIVTEQATIMVNGNLKEYQIKGLEWLVSLFNNNLNGKSC